PELIDTVAYSKGPFRAASGDFSSAGSAEIGLKNRLAGNQGLVTVGEGGYRRVFAGYSRRLMAESAGGPDLLVGLEAQRYDGPWDVAQDHRRFNGIIRLSEGSRRQGWSGTLMGYDARWT